MEATLINIIATANNSKNRPSFVSIRGYESKESGKVSNIVINIGASYENAKAKDIKMLEALKNPFEAENLELFEEARVALLAALIKPDENRSKGQIDAYTHFANGLKYHNTSKDIYIYGFKVSEETIIAGVYKTVNSKPLTIMKDRIRKLMKSTQYRPYKLGQMEQVRMNGETIEFQ